MTEHATTRLATFVAEVSEDGRGDGAHVQLIGELDLAGVPQAEAAIRSAERRHPAELVIDLSALEFLDSTGLRLLLRTRERARAQRRELRLRPGPPSVQRVFEVTQMGAAFRFDA